MDPDAARAHIVGRIDAIIQAVLCQEPRFAVATLDSALHSGFLSRTQLDAVFFHLPARLHYLRALLDERCESGLESIFRQMLVDAGIPFDLQVRVTGVGRVDFILDQRIVVETDGISFHGERTAERDYDRDLALVARGYAVIRLSYRQVIFNGTLVMAAIRVALSAHPLAVGS